MYPSKRRFYKTDIIPFGFHTVIICLLLGNVVDVCFLHTQKGTLCFVSAPVSPDQVCWEAVAAAFAERLDGGGKSQLIIDES